MLFIFERGRPQCGLDLLRYHSFDQIMDIPEYTTQEQVMFFDTDCAGVVNNIAYLRMVETCRTHLGARMGMDFSSMETTMLYPVVVSTEINYLIPAKLGDKLTIHGKLDQLERVRFWCSFSMTREGEERPLIKCRQSLAMVHVERGKPGRPIRLPAQWAEQWGDALKSST